MTERASVMDERAVWAATDRARLQLADLLESLAAPDWDRASLCAEWRIRDVVAHLALAHTGPAQALLDMVRAGGSFDRMIRDSARRHAQAPTERLVAEIRSMAGSRRKAPGVSHLEPLLDVLVHTQDIALPLGLVCTMAVDAAAAAATRVWTMGWPLSAAFHARRRLGHLRLVATDTDWRAGDGALVTGPIQPLLLLLTGRDAGRDQLSGVGMAQLGRVSP